MAKQAQVAGRWRWRDALPAARVWCGIALAIGLSVGLPGICLADASGDLDKLEDRFFQHSYAKEPASARLDRIEKLMFGETKSGSDSARLGALMQNLPADASADDSTPAAPPAKNTTPPRPSSPSRTKTAAAPPPEDDGNSASTADASSASGTKYPAVTAIEQRILGKDYASENVEKRLSRLETKVFGKPSTSTDLSERMDKLKQSTGIDVAMHPPSGSDWSDDDDFLMPPSAGGTRRSAPPTIGTSGADNEDGLSFSGRDLRKDMQQAFGGMSSGSGSGSYGMGGSSGFGSSSSGSYGFGAGLPGSTPRASSRYAAPNAVQPRMGLKQEVAALETEVLGKNYDKEPLPDRVSRLESTIFPSDKSKADQPLPDRVNSLLAAVPISGSGSKRVAQRTGDPDLDDLASTNMPPVAPQRSGLSKMINSIGNMMGGGNGFAGGYSVPGGMITDPGTGLLMDPRSGNLIDPTTGMVIGRRVAPAYPQRYGVPMGVPMGGVTPGMGMGMGMPTMMPSFGTGFSPFGFGSGINMGIGGGGMGIGRGFGMWP